MPEPTIPDDYYRDLVDFLDAGKTGQLVFHVVKGKIVGMDCNASKRDRDRVATV